MSSEMLKQASRAIRNRQYQAAQKMLVDYLQWNPNSEDAWYLLSYTVAGREGKLKYLRRARQINPLNRRVEERYLKVLQGGSASQPARAPQLTPTPGRAFQAPPPAPVRAAQRPLARPASGVGPRIRPTFPGMVRFVATDPDYTFEERAEYFTHVALVIVCLATLIFGIARLLVWSAGGSALLLGLALVGALVIWRRVRDIEGRFSEPYLVSLGGAAFAAAERRNRKTLRTYLTETVSAYARYKLFSAVFLVLPLIVLFLVVAKLAPPGAALLIYLGVVGLVLLIRFGLLRMGWTLTGDRGPSAPPAYQLPGWKTTVVFAAVTGVVVLILALRLSITP